MIPGEQMVVPRHTDTGAKETGWHLAIATQLGAEEVVRLADANGGGMFDVIELWVENVTLLEVLTPDMQCSYLATNTASHWRRVLNLPAAA